MSDEELIQAAAELLHRGDRRPFTMERLAAATGVSRATLYRRFGSRRGLMQRLTEAGILTPETQAVTDMPRRILQAARRVFGQVGFAAATVEQIAQEANVGPATVYRYFGAKEGIIRGFTKANEPRRILLAMTQHPTGDVEVDLVAFATAALLYYHENRDLIRLSFVEMGDGNHFLQLMRSSQERTAIALAHYLHNRMKAGRLLPADPAELALGFMGMIFSFAVAGPDFFNRPMGDAETAAASITRMFLQDNQPPNSRGNAANGNDANGNEGATHPKAPDPEPQSRTPQPQTPQSYNTSAHSNPDAKGDFNGGFKDDFQQDSKGSVTHEARNQAAGDIRSDIGIRSGRGIVNEHGLT